MTIKLYRAIYELATSRVDLDMPEVLWKAYIDFEIAEAELDNARALYARLLQRSSHVKVWIALALFEFEYGEGGGSESVAAAVKSKVEESAGEARGSIEAARSVFNKGYVCFVLFSFCFVLQFRVHICIVSSALHKSNIINFQNFQYRYEALKSQGLKEERLMLLEAWRDAESSALQLLQASHAQTSSREHLSAVEAKFPRKIKMKRPVFAEDGVTELGTEEYFDYVFPDDEKKMGTSFEIFISAILCIFRSSFVFYFIFFYNFDSLQWE